MPLIFLLFTMAATLPMAMAQNQSQRGRVADPQPAPYTQADFTRDCIAAAKELQEPERSRWINRTCKKPGP